MQEIKTIHLFPELNSSLFHLLENLTPEQWLSPSPINGRTVKDLASHILDGSIRRLSMQRDNFSSVSPNIKSYQDLVDFIQKLNKDWILASRRISPKILISLLRIFENELYEFFRSLDPEEKAYFAVSWAGESESKNWFDSAREYTEKWHHQMQIRLCTNKPLLMDIKYLKPLYQTLMLGLPFALKDNVSFNKGSLIKVGIIGNYNETWILSFNGKSWEFINTTNSDFLLIINIPEDIGWILFTNTDRDKEKYFSKINFKGDFTLAKKIINMVAVMS